MKEFAPDELEHPAMGASLQKPDISDGEYLQVFFEKDLRSRSKPARNAA